MHTYGLIGKKLNHSFSKIYFTEKFHQLNIKAQYCLFEIPSISDLSSIFSEELKGFNVTIPYKEQIIHYLDQIDPIAKEIGAVNTVKITDKKLIGYNTDYYGFKISLSEFIGDIKPKALILGSGGASKAVQKALKDLDIEYITVFRNGNFTYSDISENIIKKHTLIINCTPLGMYPNTDECPNIPYHFLTENHFVFDLVYNPELTLFLKKAQEYNAKTKNGLQMLYLQAEKAWEIWNI